MLAVGVGYKAAQRMVSCACAPGGKGHLPYGACIASAHWRWGGGSICSKGVLVARERFLK